MTHTRYLDLPVVGVCLSATGLRLRGEGGVCNSRRARSSGVMPGGGGGMMTGRGIDPTLR